MDKGKLKGHAALWVANIVWGLNAPIGKSVLWSEANPGGVNPFALSVYRMVGAALLFWTVSLLLPRERVARRDIALLLLASVFGIQLNQMLFLWGLSPCYCPSFESPKDFCSSVSRIRRYLCRQ